jgi:hypothetical protein
MQNVFESRLKTLIKEKFAGSWRDGWVYAQLKQEFALEAAELNAIAAALGFKYGWNAAVEQILEDQWEKDKSRWFDTLIKGRHQALNARNSEIIQRKLLELVYAMGPQDQLWLLKEIFNRYA